MAWLKLRPKARDYYAAQWNGDFADFKKNMPPEVAIFPPSGASSSLHVNIFSGDGYTLSKDVELGEWVLWKGKSGEVVSSDHISTTYDVVWT